MADKVYVDSDLKALIPKFLENRKEEIVKARTLLKENNFSELAELGHAIKGTGGGYGFNFVTELGAKIEKAAKNEDQDEIKDLVKRLEEHLENAEIIYD
ncbi:Hpt domain-containing protein [Halanaerobacter jeridensis]|uniref:HPt (Histidine-containing phosphotransfer) domain-containing protein n=1 Tax=Halanaerobacter jeridensis TaxID=706427 RepID=A0A938XV30_9FIRM|nr:Hpt domain-containing protein [Halanaerobacter jeridensis]MBM7555780.1 HPt (histidine-containing phosphotransfer) domain-containing protein [Halanaerobacter jeridensis]